MGKKSLGNGAVPSASADEESIRNSLSAIGNECALISCALMSARWFNEVKDEMYWANFYAPKCGLVWRTMAECVENGHPPTIPLVRSQIERTDDWDKTIGGEAGWTDLVNAAMHPSEGPAHLQVVRDLAARRRADQIIEQARRDLRNDTRGPGETIARLKESFEALADDCPGARTEPIISTLRDVKATEETFLWPGRIPLKRLSMVFGDPGDGKSYLTCAIAAGLASGAGWPDVNPRRPFQPADTLFISAEDLDEDYKARVAKLGGDDSRIHCLNGALSPSGKTRPWTIDNVDLLYRTCELNPRIKLVVIDPILAFTPRRNSNDAEIREPLTMLGYFAKQMNIALLYVMHANKDEDKAAVHRAGGNMALLAMPRVIFAFGPDPDSPDRRIWACVKANGMAKPPSLAMRIDDKGFHWEGGPCNLGADDILRKGKTAGITSQLGAAMDFWRACLIGQPQALMGVIKRGMANGLNKPTLFEARDKLIRLGEIDPFEMDGKKWLREVKTGGNQDGEQNGHAAF